ncbi:protein CutA homolog [Sitodiplosis mosellana]|uniref:protein CutA homolog n=1 Tax=Sitodiplosis mosellana TaxID=263140 RepID=UPI0024439AEE|nr:protein CutA homolog [Sitodiplosis mosellana]
MSVLNKLTSILFLGLVGRKSFLAAATEATAACSSSSSKNCWLPSSRMSSTSSSYTAGASSICYVTTPNEESAKKLAGDLVSSKLAACVNILPNIQSVYEWEGKINEDLEYLLMIKTTTENVQELTTYVRENHPYSVAEVISVKIESGNPPYLDWIAKNVKKPNTPNEPKA